MATKFGRLVTYLDGLLAINSHNTLIALLARSREKPKAFYISTTTALMATKLDKLVTYRYGLLSV